ADALVRGSVRSTLRSRRNRSPLVALRAQLRARAPAFPILAGPSKRKVDFLGKAPESGYCRNLKFSAPPPRSLRLCGELIEPKDSSLRRRGRRAYAEKNQIALPPETESRFNMAANNATPKPTFDESPSVQASSLLA